MFDSNQRNIPAQASLVHVDLHNNMNTKLTITSLFLALGLSIGANADSITISGVHNCCKSCENGIRKAVESVKDAKLTSSTKTSAVVEVKGKSDTKKVLAALEDAGYFGTVEGAGESGSASTASRPDKQLKGATVTGLHLCCQKCATAAAEAVNGVSGVTGHTIESKAKSFEVKGEFSQQALTAALNKAGFSGKIK